MVMYVKSVNEVEMSLENQKTMGGKNYLCYFEISIFIGTEFCILYNDPYFITWLDKPLLIMIFDIVATQHSEDTSKWIGYVYVTGSVKTSLIDQNFKFDFFCLTWIVH